MSLGGRGILITRPRELAEGLARLVEAAGGGPIRFPSLEIVDLPAPQAFSRLEQFDRVIFVSPIAARRAAKLARKWPPALRAMALGAGTRRELEKLGLARVSAPQAGADSEALLALPELEQVAGERILIVRGEGGRGLLGETLTARGASVEYAECYRRARPAADPAPLVAAWGRGEVDAVTVSSTEGLDSLFAMLGARGEPYLRATPLFVPHARVAERAGVLGVRHAIVGGPGDEETLARLVAYFAQ